MGAYTMEFEPAVSWNGEGLPPAGCECELFDCENWNPVIIKFVGDKYVVTERTDLGYEVVYCVAERPERFRPIRSESERKRLEAVRAICVTGGGNDDDFLAKRIDDGRVIGSLWFDIYDAIAAGKIPHITLK